MHIPHVTPDMRGDEYQFVTHFSSRVLSRRLFSR